MISTGLEKVTLGRYLVVIQSLTRQSELILTLSSCLCGASIPQEKAYLEVQRTLSKLYMYCPG